MLHKELISNLVKSLTKTSLNEKYLYEKLIQYKLACAKNNFDINKNITKYFNNYELKEIYNNYQKHHNTKKFHKWFCNILNFKDENETVSKITPNIIKFSIFNYILLCIGIFISSSLMCYTSIIFFSLILLIYSTIIFNLCKELDE